MKGLLNLFKAKVDVTKVESWTPGEVQAWLKQHGFKKYGYIFEGLRGRELLQLSDVELQARLPSRKDALKLAKHLEKLQRAVSEAKGPTAISGGRPLPESSTHAKPAQKPRIEIPPQQAAPGSLASPSSTANTPSGTPSKPLLPRDETAHKVPLSASSSPRKSTAAAANQGRPAHKASSVDENKEPAGTAQSIWQRTARQDDTEPLNYVNWNEFKHASQREAAQGSRKATITAHNLGKAKTARLQHEVPGAGADASPTVKALAARYSERVGAGALPAAGQSQIAHTQHYR